MKQLLIEKWSEGQPILISIVAHNMATSAQELFDILTAVKENSFPAFFSPPPPSLWFLCYRNHRHLLNGLLEVFFKIGGMPSIHAQIYGHMAKIARQSIGVDKSDTKKELSPEEIYGIHIQSIREDIENQPLKNETRDIIKNGLVTTDFLFMMKIAMPCWLLFQKHYGFLYRNARLGSLDALDMLLRLDKMQIQNPLITKWIHFYSQKKNKRDFERVVDSVKNPPRSKISLKKVKYNLAGFISVFSELLNHRISAPEIQNLFDAVAIDFGHDELRDQDLQDSPEAFAKAVQRERAFWKTALLANRTKNS